MSNYAPLIALLQSALIKAEALADIGVPPPTTGSAVTLVRTPVKLNPIVALEKQLGRGARYERFQHHLCLTDTAISLPFSCNDQTKGGLPTAFAYPRYGLLIGKHGGPMTERATCTVAVGAKAGVLAGPLGTETDGEYITRIVAYDATGVVVATPVEGLATFGIWIDRNGLARQSRNVLVQNGNFDWEHLPPSGLPFHSYAVVPKAMIAPVARPLALRIAVPHFATVIPDAQIARTQLVLSTDTIDQDVHYPCVTDRGITVTDNQQGYEPVDMFLFPPRLPLIDGERGIATAPHTLFLKGGRNGKWYGGGPASLYVIDSTGYKRTFCGIRHKDAPTYWETPPGSISDSRLEIMGVWDATVPINERAPKEPWNLAWDAQSLLLDDMAVPVGGEQPHLPYMTTTGERIIGPRYFWVDAFNRLCEGQTDGANRMAPHAFRVRVKGLSDPWSCVTRGRSIYVTERGRHAISEWSMDTFAKIRDVLVDPTASMVGSVSGSPSRRFRWSAAYITGIAAARTHSICAPEGVDLQDDWLYFGSLAQAEVKRVNLVSGVVEHHVFVDSIKNSMGGVGSYYMQIAVGDGTFGPRGTVFVTTFYNGNFGKPEAFLPDGSIWSYYNYAKGVGSGVGGNWNGSHYATAVAVFEGRMACADSSGGINVFNQAEPVIDGLPVDAARAQRGWEQWREQGYSVLHGPYAINRNSVPLPAREVRPDVDYWLDSHGVV